MIILDTSGMMTEVQPHRLCYYGMPATADARFPLITLVGGIVIDVLDDWQTGFDGWSTIRFSGTEAVFRRVQAIAAIVSGNLEVHAGVFEPDPPSPEPPWSPLPEAKDDGDLWRTRLAEQESAAMSATR